MDELQAASSEFFKDLQISDFGDKLTVYFNKRKEFADMKRAKIRIEQTSKIIREHKPG